jgi:hypothetical protein
MLETRVTATIALPTKNFSASEALLRTRTTRAQRQLPPGGHRASGSQTNPPSSAMDVEPARRPLGWNGKPKGRGLFKPDEVRLATPTGDC